jgi:arylsulfatase A-like enzyme
VSLIDHWVGRVVEALRQVGRLDRTILVFTSDHGDSLGDHGHSQKWNFYEQSVRVPLIVRAPQLLAARGEIAAIVQSIDIVPALLTLAGAPTPEWVESVTVLPALQAETFAGRPAVYCEQGRDVVFQFADFVSMLRTDRWKLVHFMGAPFGQLFDLHADPQEEENLWDSPGMRHTKSELVTALHDWRMRSGYATRAWTEDCR